VRLSVAAGVATVTLDRPARGNALDLAAARRLEQVTGEVAGRRDVSVILLRAEGRHFCVGGDIHAMTRADAPAAWVREVADTTHRAIANLHTMEVVVLAAIQGAAAGAGLSLALVADLVLVTSTTSFVAAWPAIGLTPDGGASWLLPRAVGSHRAAQMMLADRRLSGQEALEWGLAHELVAEGELDSRAGVVAETVAAGAHRALGRTRQLLRRSWDVGLGTQLDLERDSIAEARRDSQEFLDAFLERNARRGSR
jgi:2-(1,2-epoxy-1,2-dihydrophenyl)acetyl-CoA isomerase